MSKITELFSFLPTIIPFLHWTFEIEEEILCIQFYTMRMYAILFAFRFILKDFVFVFIIFARMLFVEWKRAKKKCYMVRIVSGNDSTQLGALIVSTSILADTLIFFVHNSLSVSNRHCCHSLCSTHNNLGFFYLDSSFWLYWSNEANNPVLLIYSNVAKTTYRI